MVQHRQPESSVYIVNPPKGTDEVAVGTRVYPSASRTDGGEHPVEAEILEQCDVSVTGNRRFEGGRLQQSWSLFVEPDGPHLEIDRLPGDAANPYVYERLAHDLEVHLGKTGLTIVIS